MFVFGIEDDVNFTRRNLAFISSKEARNSFEIQLDSVFQNRPPSFKISGLLFTKNSRGNYEIFIDRNKVFVTDIDDFFFEELPEAQDFVISLI